MIFGKIEYLNLLPFHLFMKRYTKTTQQKMSMNYKHGVPAKINDEFQAKRVDGAFISSIKAKKYRYVNVGIIAKKEVLSVLVIPNEKNLLDKASASSNVLAKILNIQGKVLIGDNALRYYFQNKPAIDLAKEWQKKYHLPFVFALLCFHKEQKNYKKIEKNFLKTHIKIPQYILKKASKQTNIQPQDILFYLQHISYDLDKKAKLGLKKFYTLQSKIQ
ncbi:Menaquinone via 6-amino-6-deoxyfutalosine step 1 [hydrothermal vent metagenome]|uniref:Menaquinone via 6-amino-6-deoxyfutalosine step 1 n=1 Tax=hydrothermal vent metagenome TaxID=652676 RepID=A0A1W1D2N0_9ZZZZ